MLKKLLLILSLLVTQKAIAQIHLDHNGIRTSITSDLSTQATPSKFLLAEIGYNSHHWQRGGSVVIELFSHYYSTGYQRYVVEVGSERGTFDTFPLVFLREAYGHSQSGKIELGTPSGIGTSYGGYGNFSVPIYLNLRYYARYKIRITYMQDKVDHLTDINQIKLYENPIGTTTTEFAAPNVDVDLKSTGSLQVGKIGSNHYLIGNLGIGTETPAEKLSVNGNIRAKEVKAESSNWPDYVFGEGYPLKSLSEIEKFIKVNKHLPEMPTSKQVALEGIELGEMNKLLLKKIEELTLLLIDKDRELKRETVVNDQQSIDIRRLYELLANKK